MICGEVEEAAAPTTVMGVLSTAVCAVVPSAVATGSIRSSAWDGSERYSCLVTTGSTPTSAEATAGHPFASVTVTE